MGRESIFLFKATQLHTFAGAINKDHVNYSSQLFWEKSHASVLSNWDGTHFALSLQRMRLLRAFAMQ